HRDREPRIAPGKKRPGETHPPRPPSVRSEHAPEVLVGDLVMEDHLTRLDLRAERGRTALRRGLLELPVLLVRHLTHELDREAALLEEADRVVDVVREDPRARALRLVRVVGLGAF